MDIHLSLPVDFYCPMAAEAARRNSQVKHLFAGFVLDLVRDPKRLQARSESASRRKWDDRSIAQQLGIGSLQVAKWRRGIGVEPNLPGKGKGQI